MPFVENKASSSKQRQSSNSQPSSRTNKQAGGHKGQRVKSNQARRERADLELKELHDRIEGYDDKKVAETFSELPITSKTQKGLKSCHFVSPTPVQALTIPPSLRGRDVLGSAKTGSGKTLAFLIPLLERLYALKWGPLDGLGAVVISPTRELAVQTFNQLRDIGKYHSFSAGLVIGGKPLKEERDRLGRMNILIATPGRLLQHLDSTVGFESSGLKVLVLDEADRLLDLGFLPALKAVVSHFTTRHSDPHDTSTSFTGRQTLLFSATQSSDLAALAKLSLRDPLYINCNKPGEEGVVPTNLEQFYAVVPLDRKLDALWGFIKSHLKMKGVVFVTSGKQVRFIFETFRRLHPGIPLMHLHGKLKQPTRLSIFSKFSTSRSALLISTDVAARGLDFPSVDWVIQLDCPDDVDSYIHRVGRTARYQSEGKGLCLLCPSEEEGMVKRWEGKGLEVKKIKIKDSKMGSLTQQMQNLAFKDPEVKYLGQRAFISYMRSVHLQKDKTVFDLSALPAEAFAASLGLPGAPQIKLLEKGSKVRARGPAPDQDQSQGDTRQGTGNDGEVDDESGENRARDVVGSSESEGEGDEASEGIPAADGHRDEDEDEDDSSQPQSKAAPVRTKYDRMFQRQNQSILAPHYSAMIADDEDDGLDDEDVFTLKRGDHDISDDDLSDDGLARVPPRDIPTDDTAATDKAKGISGSKDLTGESEVLDEKDLSKRKLKALTSKKGLLKSRPTGERILFDESGNATTYYQSGKDVESEAAARARREEYVSAEKERMKDATKVDREVAREIKREKKRKRKEREKETRKELDDYSGGEDGPGIAMLASPQLDGSEAAYSAEEAEEEPRSTKRGRAAASKQAGLEDEEALALRLLQG